MVATQKPFPLQSFYFYLGQAGETILFFDLRVLPWRVGVQAGTNANVGIDMVITEGTVKDKSRSV